MSLGQLVVRLGLDAADFTAGMTKAEVQASRLARKLDAALSAGAAALGTVTVAAAGAAVALNRVVGGIANYQDLAEKIGDSAEAVASLKTAADVSGVALESVAGASVKLTAALSKTDDESKAVGQAIQYLGLNFEDFKKLNPVDQLDAVALAMGNVQRGSDKTAVAVALFGKSGAELMPFLNDLASGSERMVTLTEAQIKAANDYDEQLKAVTSQVSTLGQQTAAGLIPQMSAMVSVFGEAVTYFKETNVGASVLAGTLGVLDFALRHTVVLGAEIAQIFNVAGKAMAGYAAIAARLAKFDLTGARAVGEAFREDLALSTRDLLAFRAKIENPGAIVAGAGGGRGFVNPAAAAAGVVQPRFNPAPKKPEAEKTTEAERYLEALQKQLNKSQELTVLQTVMSDLESGRLKLSKGISADALLAVASQIDAAKKLQEIDEARSKAAKDFAAEKERVDALAQAGRERVIAEGAAVFEATRSNLEKLAAEEDRLRALLDAGAISWDTYSRAIFEADERLGTITTALTEAQLAGQRMGDSVADAFERMVFEGARVQDVLKQLAVDFLKVGFKKAVSAPLADAAGKFFGNIFGGRANGGPVTAGGLYEVNERGPGELFTSGGKQYLLPGADGFVTPGTRGLAQGGNGGTSISQNISIDARGADPSVALRIEAAMRRAKAETLAAVQANANRGGGFARSMGRA